MIDVSQTDIEIPCPTAFANDGVRNYVASQTGQIYQINLNQISIFKDISRYVTPLNPGYDERGLLGLAFWQNRCFVYYTSNADGIYEGRLAELRGNDQNILFTVPLQENIHLSGNILIDNFGYLFLSLGDNGPQQDPNGHAQDLNSPLGKILRFKITSRGIEIPSDNPFVNYRFARKEIYAYGFRNIWGMTFNKFGQLFAADVGLNNREELDRIIPGGNYGWNFMEGTMMTGFNQNQVPNNMINPVFEYPTKRPGNLNLRASAIVGGQFLNDGRYIFGDFGGAIMILDQNFNLNSVDSFPQNVRATGRGFDNNIYIIGGGVGPNSVGSLWVVK